MSEITELITEGRAKRLYATTSPDEAVVYYRDETFAYHGLKRGRIIGKGEIVNRICAHVFTLLEQNGIPTHFIRMLDERSSLIKRVEIIPFSVTVRNIAAGSLSERLGIVEGTRLKNTVVEMNLKSDDLDYPMINLSHITAMELATVEEVQRMKELALRVNEVLSAYMAGIQIELIDFKLEFGRFQGEVVLADEVSPDNCRFWDARTHEPLDIDCFRHDLGNAEEAYREVLHRMSGDVFKSIEEE